MSDRQQIPEGDLVVLLDAVARLAPVPMLITDCDGHFLAANRHWTELSGAAGDALAEEGWAASLDPASRVRLAHGMDRCAESGDQIQLDIEILRAGGRRWSRWWMQRRLIEDTRVIVTVALDVHDDVSQRNDLRHLATRDDLTGLVNRRVFLETVEQALRRTERFGEPAGLLYVDLDSFKAVNDQAGHVVGDRVLAAVAGRLRKAVRGADVVGRIGGDEFAVLLERLTSRGEAAVVARRIQEALSGTVEVGGDQWPISASVGIALAEGPSETAIGLLARADQAMYAAKRNRNAPPPDAASPVAPSLVSAAPSVADPVRASTRTAPSSPVTPAHSNHAQPTISAADLRLLREGMDTIRQSLEALLEGLERQEI